MNTLVVYDSQFGNTEKVAQKIAETLDQFGTARACRIADVTPQAIGAYEMLIVGCPTQAWHTTPAMKTFLAQLANVNTAHLALAAFDTRLDKPGWLTGSAAQGMGKVLHRMQGKVLLPPESFLVSGKEGPLVSGELERAVNWAHDLYEAFQERMATTVVPM